MKKTYLFALLLTICFQTIVFSQEKNSLLTILKNSIEEQLTPKKTNSNKKVENKQNPTNSRLPSKNLTNNDQLIEIPVVFHVVHKTMKQGAIPNQKFTEVINLINLGFNEVNKKLIDENYRNIVASCNIQFDFASKIINCPPDNDITWHYTLKETFKFYDTASFTGNLPYDQELKKNGYQDSKKVLNIWVCDLDKDGLGYSTFPTERNEKNDGIVLDYILLKTTSKVFLQSVIVHEIGHYLGLQHIWGKGPATGSANRCLLPHYTDDGIEDTPKQPWGNLYLDVKEGRVQPICGDKNTLSNYQNFMDYSYMYGMFTNGQKEKMRN